MNKEIVFQPSALVKYIALPKAIPTNRLQPLVEDVQLPEVLFITSYPPRECGIATYSQDLIKALNSKFSDSFSFKVCALESGVGNAIYPNEVKHVFNTKNSAHYLEMANKINADKRTQLVLIQHEFGLFKQNEGIDFLQFLYSLNKPAVTVFHTVLPNPDTLLRENVRHIVAACASVIVMTRNAAKILQDDYGIASKHIEVIPHGTHLVTHLDKAMLKDKYGLQGRKILSTFGLLSSGKSIETTLSALPNIIENNPDVLFLILGKTHPSVLLSDGESYREMLENKVLELNLNGHVKFVNQYLPLADLLEYLQMSDIYLFTSNDPNQAVSGTFAYAMSCGCPIISTPIPHAKEVLHENTGILVDFQNADQLADAANRLLGDETLRMEFSMNTLQRIVPTAWENSAISHAKLLQKTLQKTKVSEATNISPSTVGANTGNGSLHYILPPVNLAHVKEMTTDVGIIQFSIINQPDIASGYTLDDNARALIAMCMHYEATRDKNDLVYIRIYLDFIENCLQPAGDFLNYVDSEKRFTDQNYETNLSDSNGRAIWALGLVISKYMLLPADVIATAESVMERVVSRAEMMYSTRTMAFMIKGLYYYNLKKKSEANTTLIRILANRLVQMHRHESEQHWQWYESYLTYANSLLPEAMLCAYQATGEDTYKDIALRSFDFLLGLTFDEHSIKVISNRSWMHKGSVPSRFGEQPIDVAYTILSLSKFYDVFHNEKYFDKINIAFSWFLGNNHLNHIIYNPCTGGCYDGLEEHSVNLNQGSESTLSYLISRLVIGKYADQ